MEFGYSTNTPTTRTMSRLLSAVRGGRVTITTRHPASAHGIPVVLDPAGEPMAPAAGVRAALVDLCWSQAELAKRCGVATRTVEHWLASDAVPAAALNVLRDALEGGATG